MAEATGTLTPSSVEQVLHAPALAPRGERAPRRLADARGGHCAGSGDARAGSSTGTWRGTLPRETKPRRRAARTRAISARVAGILLARELSAEERAEALTPRRAQRLLQHLDLDEDELERIGVPDVVLDAGGARIGLPGDELARRGAVGRR